MRKSSFNSKGGKGQQRSSQGGGSRPQSRPAHGGGGRPQPRGGGQTQSMHSSLPKSWRQITGTHAVKEVLRVRPQSVKQAIVQKNLMSTPEVKELLAIFRDHDIRFEERSEPELAKITQSHQGVIVFSDYNPAFDYTHQAWEHESMIVALDGVEDTHNLGAILRTSWLMGVSGVIIPSDRAVGLTPTVHKVACGGAEHVEIARINNFNEPFEKLKEAGFWVYGLSHKAEKSIYDIEYPEKVIWVLGAEDKGLRSTTERVCDELVSIPQAAADASYNVSVATAMALAETKRQWAAKNKK